MRPCATRSAVAVAGPRPTKAKVPAWPATSTAPTISVAIANGTRYRPRNRMSAPMAMAATGTR